MTPPPRWGRKNQRIRDVAGGVEATIRQKAARHIWLHIFKPHAQTAQPQLPQPNGETAYLARCLQPLAQYQPGETQH